MSRESDTERIAELWTLLNETRDLKYRDLLIEAYLPLVQRVAGKMARSIPRGGNAGTVDVDDLVQYGSIGLMRAMTNFVNAHFKEGEDPPFPNLSRAFETYCVPSIRGVILDKLRETDWAPRSLRKKSRDVERARLALEETFSCEPTVAQVAEVLGWTRQEVEDVLRGVEVARFASLDVGSDYDGEEDGSARYAHLEDDRVPDPETSYRTGKVYRSLVDLIRGLPRQDQFVLALYYSEGLTLVQAGQVAGIPESRASQIHTRAMMAIRERLVDFYTEGG